MTIVIVVDDSDDLKKKHCPRETDSGHQNIYIYDIISRRKTLLQTGVRKCTICAARQFRTTCQFLFPNEINLQYAGIY